MLAIGIKNSILVLLIILILHFLIKNTLVDRASKLQKSAVKPPSKETFKGNETVKEECNPAPAPPRNSEAEKEELLKYVFGDDNKKEDDNDDLRAFFGGNDVTRDVQGELAKRQPECQAPKKDDNALPLSDTCDPGIMSIKDDAHKPVSADCDLPQKMGVMLLKEYENENAMNGGKLYGGLDGFDGFATHFEDYAACGGAAL